MMDRDTHRSVMMLGTFGFRPKATMSARALGLAQAMRHYGWVADIGTVPWDYPSDAGREWDVGGVHVFNTRFTSPYAAPLAVAEIRLRILRQRPDLIHVFKPKGFGDLAARLGVRVPLVVDMDDWEGYRGWNDALPYGRLQRRLFDWQERTLPRRAAAVTAASRTLVQRAIELGVHPDRVFYLPNGLTAARLQQIASEPADLPAAVCRLPDRGGPRLLVYTRFVEFGPAPLVQSLSALAEAYPQLRLVVAGSSADGAPERQLAREAGRAGVADRILSLGWIDPAHLGAMARRCHVAVFPFEDTIINRSKCSVKVLEVLAAGIPVVATSVGENRGYIDGGVSGILVRPGDSQSLADGIRAFLSNPDLAREAATRARQRATSQFTWDRLAATARDAYDVALAAGIGRQTR
jgi:glycosyltransferase involved in cell wall biosynthesis